MTRSAGLLMAILVALPSACGGSAPPPPATQQKPAKGNTELRVAVEGLSSDQGIVRAALFASAEGFPGDSSKAVRRKAVSITKQGTANVRFADLVPGTYAVSVTHDTNANGKLDTNFIGIPTEGVGSSNNPRPRMGPPSFEEARFTLPAAGTSITIVVTNI